MKNLELTLEINGENKIFVCSKVKGVLLRRTASVMKVFDRLEKEFSEDVMDELVDYVVDIFENKFTREEYYNGIDLAETMPKIQEIAGQIMDMATSKIKN